MCLHIHSFISLSFKTFIYLIHGPAVVTTASDHPASLSGLAGLGSICRVTWVSLTLGVGYLFTAAPAKPQPLLLTLDEGYLLTAALPDLQRC